MVQNDPRTKDNTTINEKKEKYQFFPIFGRFWTILGSPGSKKVRRFFALESISNGMKRDVDHFFMFLLKF